MPGADRFEHYLLPDERRVLEFTYHWMYLTRPVAVFAAAMAVGAGILAATDRSTFGWVVFLLLLAWTGVPVLTAVENRHAVRLIVTDSRVVFVEGWIVKRYGMMPLSKITDVTIKEPVLGRIFGYGTLLAESPGQDQALSRVDFLPEPLTVWHTISDLLYAQGARSRAGADTARREADERRLDPPAQPDAAPTPPPTAGARRPAGPPPDRPWPHPTGGRRTAEVDDPDWADLVQPEATPRFPETEHRRR